MARILSAEDKTTGEGRERFLVQRVIQYRRG
jgi:hypothetical protein